MVDAVVFWSCTVIYLGVTFVLAYMGYKKTKHGEDFLLAGRSVPSWIIGLSYGSTFISTSAIVGFGGVAAQLGLGIIWLTVLCIGVGVIIAFLFYGRRVRRLGQGMKAMTFPDFLGKRFKSPFLQYSTSFLILVSMPLYSSAVLIGGSRFLQTTLGIQYESALLSFAIITAIYVVFGGLLAVLYTDAFQGFVMLLGLSAIMILTWLLFGGVDASNIALANLVTDPGVPAGLSSKGMTGWTSFPSFGSEIWFTMVTTIIMGVGIGVLAQPQLTVRFMTAKSTKSLNRAVPVGAIFIGLSTAVAFTVGALSNVYFYDNLGKLSTQVAGNNVDLIIPMFINASMPDIIVVLFMLTLLAAAMSTLSSLFHTMGSAAGHDLWCYIGPSRLVPEKYRLCKEKEYKSTLKGNRVGTGIMIVVSVALAFVMPDSIIARATAMFMGLCAAAFLPMFTYGIFAKNPSAFAAKVSLVMGALSWFLWTVFVHIKESSVLGICKFFFNKDALLGSPYTVIDPLVIAMPISIIALIVAWALDPARKAAKAVQETA
ncbi:MAG: sodium/panthothenate symporter [Methanomassiliicoccales archaeon PtaU1.Bin124]|nr:MAG: sodium/panthothenate symporter [Methanomassiliicoccales archaeon PtaU1.Bin124]